MSLEARARAILAGISRFPGMYARSPDEFAGTLYAITALVGRGQEDHILVALRALGLQHGNVVPSLSMSESIKLAERLLETFDEWKDPDLCRQCDPQ